MHRACRLDPVGSPRHNRHTFQLLQLDILARGVVTPARGVLAARRIALQILASVFRKTASWILVLLARSRTCCAFVSVRPSLLSGKQMDKREPQPRALRTARAAGGELRRARGPSIGETKRSGRQRVVCLPLPHSRLFIAWQLILASPLSATSASSMESAMVGKSVEISHI